MGIFDQTFAVVNDVDRLVSERIADATATSEALTANALATIAQMGNVSYNFNGSVPSTARPDMSFDVTLNLPEINPQSFGEITSDLPDGPIYEEVPPLFTLVIPDFTPSITGLSIPEPPAASAPLAPPERPVTGTVTLPDAPVISLPPLPLLDVIEISEFAGLTMPLFDATAPEFEGSALPGILQWSEPVYTTEILDEVLVKIRDLWSGGSGIPPAVEQAMVERAHSREDMTANREIASVDEEFSMRGFTMPTGMQAARVDQLRQDLAIKKLGLNRDLTIEFAKWQIENIRFGVEQAIAAENVYVNLFNNMAERTFVAARFQVESQISVYNAQVSLFNARMQAYQIEASVFDTLVRAEMTKVEVFKAEIEADIARGQLNEQRVRVYTAQIEAINTQIEIYKAQMQGASVQADVIRTQIEGYRADVQAYAERIQADRVRYDAYKARIDAEVAKAGIIDAEARAYAALVQGKSSVADVEIKRSELVIRKNESRVNAYAAALNAEKTRLQSQSAVISAGAQAYVADTQRFSAVAQAETAKAQLEVSATEAAMRTNIAYYEARVRSYLGQMEQSLRQAELIAESLRAAGQLSTTLAAGSMAGVHVGATLSGGGSVSAGGSSSESMSTTNSTSVNKNYNYEGT